MASFIEKVRRFLYGRYGFDRFGGFLFILSMVFWAISLLLRFTPFRKVYFVFWLLNTLIYVYAIFRILSRNTYRRQRENERYLRIREKVVPRAQKFKREKMDADYFFKVCPHCGTRLRLRRVRGKHNTRCPKCGTRFTVRVWFGKK